MTAHSKRESPTRPAEKPSTGFLVSSEGFLFFVFREFFFFFLERVEGRGRRRRSKRVFLAARSDLLHSPSLSLSTSPSSASSLRLPLGDDETPSSLSSRRGRGAEREESRGAENERGRESGDERENSGARKRIEKTQRGASSGFFPSNSFFFFFSVPLSCLLSSSDAWSILCSVSSGTDGNGGARRSGEGGGGRRSNS